MLEVAICDDDKEDLDKAALMLDKILSEYQVQYQIRSFLSANELLNNNDKIDIGILDISMEELGGITLGRKLKEKNHDIIHFLRREMLDFTAFPVFFVTNLLLVQRKKYYFNRATVSRNCSIVL